MICRLKYFLLIFVVCISAVVSVAQGYNVSSENNKAIKNYHKATEAYKLGNTSESIFLLKKAVKYDANFIEAWLLLGDVYTDIDSINNAIESYEKAISIDSVFFMPAYYFLGNLYIKEHDFVKAKAAFQHINQDDNISIELMDLNSKALEKVAFLDEIYKNRLPIEITNLGEIINTDGDEYVNYLNSEVDYIMFTRRMELLNSSTGRRYRESLFHAYSDDGVWNKPSLINQKWMKDLNMGSLNLSADGRQMYLTGCYWPGSKGSCDIYLSEKIGDTWELPKSFEKGLNTSGWESQPTISSDGRKLYFASKRAGGKGGSDIWMSVKLKNGDWSLPVNLGDSINTSGDEMSPVIHADGRTLYFSSNGYLGVGGMDLFLSRKDETGIWSIAKNLGVPINTEKNEINIFISLDGKNSWISSDRKGGQGNFDIWEFDNVKEIIPQKIAYVSGIVVDNVTLKPLKAKVEVTNLTTLSVVNSTYSDSINGSFLIILFPGIDYAFNISKPGYLFLSENINLTDTIIDKNTVVKNFELIPIGKDKQLILNNINFEFNKSRLLPSSEIELKNVVQIIIDNPEYNLMITGHTDSIGNNIYNQKLSLNRAESVYNYLINNGIDSKRLAFEGKGSDKPVMSNNTEEGRAANRRTEITFL